MQVTRLPRDKGPSDVAEIVEAVSVGEYQGNLRAEVEPLTRFRLFARSYDGPGWRYVGGGFGNPRRSRFACWYAHRDVLGALFDEWPNLRIRTSLADYNGRDGFELEYPLTGTRNIGSMMAPAFMPERCGEFCSHTTREVGGTVSQSLSHAAMLACPFSIMAGDHYDEGGQCKCRQPEEQARMIREWDYTPADFARVGLR